MPVRRSNPGCRDTRKIAWDFEESCRALLRSRCTGETGAPFRGGREAVRMFLRGPFAFVFFQAVKTGRREQCGIPLRNLLAIY